MAQIVGQVYNPEFLAEKEVDGKKKSSQFRFTLGHRKAFPREGEKNSMLFTNCVAYGLAKMMNENFGSSEHHGKSVLLNGHWDEYEITPDFDNEYHAKYLHKETLTKAYLEQLGFIFGEGSRESVTVQVAPKTTMRRFVVNSIEFVGGNAVQTSSESKANKGGMRVVDEGAVEDPVPVGAGEKQPWEM